MKFRILDNRTKQLAHRPWTTRERKVVWRGLTGRMGIAIEPLLGLLFMVPLLRPPRLGMEKVALHDVGFEAAGVQDPSEIGRDTSELQSP